MSELLRFFKDMRDNGYGLAEIAAQLGTSAIAEPVAGFAAMYDPVHGADAIREGMTYQPRTQAAQEYSQSVGNAAKTAIKPAMPIIDTWKKGVDIAGSYSPVAGAMLRTVPAAIGVAMGAKPALQAGRQVSEGLGAMQGRMIANANAPRTLNTGFMGQRGAINPSDFNLVTNPDGTVTMYHGTTKDAAQKIIQERKLLSAGEPDVYMTTDPMAGYGDGTTVKFKIWRDGTERELTAKLVENDTLAKANSAESNGGESSEAKGVLSGVRVEALTPEAAKRRNLSESARGVLITEVDPNSNAAASGLRPGMVIEEVARQPIANLSDFNAALQKLGNKKSVLLSILTTDGPRYVVVKDEE